MTSVYAHKTHPIALSTHVGQFAAVAGDGLTATDLRVLLHLVGQLHTGSGSTVWVYFVDIAEALRCDRSSVSRAIRRLEQLGVIETAKHRPGWNSEIAVTIDPFLVYRGSGQRMVDDKRSWGQRRW